MNMNKAHLMGRLGHDPVMRTTQKGTRVTTFSLATQGFIKTKNENETTWHRIVAWGKTAELSSKYLKKGSAVYVDGTMKVRKFEGEDGKMNYMHEIHTTNIKFLGYKKADSLEARSAEESFNTEVSNELAEPHHQS